MALGACQRIIEMTWNEGNRIKYVHANPSGIVPHELNLDTIFIRGRGDLLQYHRSVRHGQPCGLDGKMTTGTDSSTINRKRFSQSN